MALDAHKQSVRTVTNLDGKCYYRTQHIQDCLTAYDCECPINANLIGIFSCGPEHHCSPFYRIAWPNRCRSVYVTRGVGWVRALHRNVLGPPGSNSPPSEPPPRSPDVWNPSTFELVPPIPLNRLKFNLGQLNTSNIVLQFAIHFISRLYLTDAGRRAGQYQITYLEGNERVINLDMNAGAF